MKVKEYNISNEFCKVSTDNAKESYNKFLTWFEKNDIKSFDQSLERKYRNDYWYVLSNNITNSLLDHVSFWKDRNKKSHLILQPYSYYPIGYSCFESQVYNRYNKSDEVKSNQNVRTNLHNLEINAEKLGFTITYYKSSESWYSPNKSIMIDLKK